MNRLPIDKERFAQARLLEPESSVHQCMYGLRLENSRSIGFKT